MKSIASALAAAQINMGKALKQSTNPHFKRKYADLGNVMDACLPALNEAGIAVIQPAGEDETGRYVETVFIHGESGEKLSCRVPIICRDMAPLLRMRAATASWQWLALRQRMTTATQQAKAHRSNSNARLRQSRRKRQFKIP
jgi:hypothetical protein